MDPTKALNFQTFPHQNGQHIGTMGPNGPIPMPGHMHSRAGSQSMVSIFIVCNIATLLVQHCLILWNFSTKILVF